jgi:hypothetical protein
VQPGLFLHRAGAIPLVRRPGCTGSVSTDKPPHSYTSLMTFLPTFVKWTKSLHDSLELTELVMLRGMRRCAALDRRRERAGRTPSLTGSKDRHTLFAWKEQSDTILIYCINCAIALLLQEPATFVVLLHPIDLMCRAPSPSARVVCQLPHDT